MIKLRYIHTAVAVRVDLYMIYMKRLRFDRMVDPEIIIIYLICYNCICLLLFPVPRSQKTLRSRVPHIRVYHRTKITIVRFTWSYTYIISLYTYYHYYYYIRDYRNLYYNIRD